MADITTGITKYEGLNVTFGGNVSLAATKKLYLDGSGDTYLFEQSADRFQIYVGGAEYMDIDQDALYAVLGSSTTNNYTRLLGGGASVTVGDGSNNAYVGINDTTPTYGLDINGTTHMGGYAYIDERIIHTGDTDTYLRFVDNNPHFFAGGVNVLDLQATETAFTGDTFQFLSANSEDPVVQIKNSTNDAFGSRLRFNKDRGAAGQDGDLLGMIDWIGKNDAGSPETIEYARIQGLISDASDGAEGGKLRLGVASHDGDIAYGLVLTDGDADGEVDATIGASAGSLTTVAGDLSIYNKLTFRHNDNHYIQSGTNNWAFKANSGTSALLLTTGGAATFGGAITIPDYIVHDGDTNTYFGFSGADTYALVTGGTTALTVSSAQAATFTGDVQAAGVYIGSTNTSYDLYNNGTSYFNDNVIVDATLTVSGGNISISGDGSNAATLTESSAGILTIATVDDFKIDAGGDISLDAEGADIRFKDGTTHFGTIKNDSSHLVVEAATADKDIIFKGTDGSTETDALRLDMSEGGNASFSGNVDITGTDYLYLGSHVRINNPGSGVFKVGNYNGSAWTDTLSITNAGQATFTGNSNVMGDGSTSSGTSVLTLSTYEPFLVFKKGRDASSGYDYFKIKCENDDLAVDFTTAYNGGSDGRTARITSNGRWVIGGHEEVNSSQLSVQGNFGIKQPDDSSFDGGLTIERSANTQKVHIGMDGGAVNFNSPDGLSFKFRNNGSEKFTVDGLGALVSYLANGKWRVNSYGGMYFRNSSNATHESYIHSRSDGSLSIGRVAESDWTGSGNNAYAATTYDHVTFDTSSNATFAGNVALAATKKLYLDGGTHTYLTEVSADRLNVVVGNKLMLDLGEDSDYIDMHAATVGIHSSDSQDPHFFIKNTNADANAPRFSLIKDSASPADNDDIGRIYAYGDNDAGEQMESMLIRNQMTDVSDGAEASKTTFYNYSGGTQYDTLVLDGYNAKVNNWLGIGTNPSTTVHAYGSAPVIRIQDGGDKASNASGYLEFYDHDSMMMNFGVDDGGGAGINLVNNATFTLKTNNSVALTINASQIPTFRNGTASGTAMYIHNWTNAEADTKTLIDFRVQGSDNSPFYVAGQIGSKAEGTWTSTSSSRDASLIFNTVLNGDNELALTLDSNKLATFAGAITTASTIAAGSTIHRGNMTIDSQEIDVGSGDLLIDVAGDITLDAGGNDIRFFQSGTEYGKFKSDSSDFAIYSSVQDKDMIFRGNDGGSTIDALTLDMSNGGSATFLDDVDVGANLNMISASSPTIQVKDTTNNCILKMYSQDSESIIGTYSAHNLKFFTDSGLTLTLDTSHNATFAGDVTISGNLTHSGGDFNLPSGAQIDWANGDARIVEGDTNNYSLSFQTYDGSACSTALRLDGDNTATFAGNISLADSKYVYWGGSNDFYIGHTGSATNMINSTGALNIEQHADDGNIVFKSDDGNGGIFDYFSLDGGSTTYGSGATTAAYTKWQDKSRIALGTGKDLQLFHDGSNTFIENATGNFDISQLLDNGDMRFRCDDGAGSTRTYFFLDGSLAADGGLCYTTFPDNSVLDFGDSQDLKISHQGGHSYIENGTGNLIITSGASDQDMLFKGNDGGSTITALTLDMSAAGKATFNNDVVAYSDRKLKKDIKTLDGSKVYDMRGVSFIRKDTEKEGSGVVAQELQKVAPELVTETNGTLGVSYGNITGYLIEAIKDLKAEIEELKKHKCNDCTK